LVCGSIGPFPDCAAATASSPVLVGSVSSWMTFALPAAAVRCATATAVSALALHIYAAGGVWIRQHCNPRAQVGDLLITQGQQTWVQLRLG
jgi:hypothetical protein